MSHKVLRVGIMSKEVFIARTMEIVKGEYKPKASEPKIWFESLQAMAQVLSNENKKLLRIIAEQKPNSLKELEEITGRKVSNLSRTLHKMAGYGIVELRKEKKQLKPVVTATDIHLSYSIL